MHRLWNTIALALRNLTLHKLRVLLTILGLIFGVASVIAMLSIAEGASAEAQRQIAELGATNVIVRSTSRSMMSTRRGSRTTRASSSSTA